MYFYILDQGKQSIEKFERLYIELQSLLNEFNISGEMARVTPLRSLSDCIETASLRGVKTLVVCGSDDTFNLVLAQLKGRDFTVAFIPTTPSESYLAGILGLTNLRIAVKTIAARRIERLDMAQAGPVFFISWLEFGVTSQNIRHMGLWASIKLLTAPGKALTVRIDNSYDLDLSCLGGLVVNSRSTTAFNEALANPTDGFLDLLIMEKLSSYDVLRFKKDIANGILEKVPRTSVIKCKRLDFLEPEGMSLTISGKVMVKAPVSVEIIPKRLKLIVGKARTF